MLMNIFSVDNLLKQTNKPFLYHTVGFGLKISQFLLIFLNYRNKGHKGGQIKEIVNIEGFNGFHGVKYAYTSSTNGFTCGTTVILSSHMHWPHI